jgi:hypothetical protein
MQAPAAKAAARNELIPHGFVFQAILGRPDGRKKAWKTNFGSARSSVRSVLEHTLTG